MTNTSDGNLPFMMAYHLTRQSLATAVESELCFHFILHNSSFSLSVRRLAVGSGDWLGLLGSLQTILSSTNKYVGHRGINQNADKETDKERCDVHRSALVKRMLGCADVVKRHQTLH